MAGAFFAPWRDARSSVRKFFLMLMAPSGGSTVLASMRKKLRLSRTLRRLPLVAAAATTALALHACGRAEAEPQADPVQVQAFLDQVEAEQRLIAGEARARSPADKTIRNLVEGATVRAPSEAAINRLETAVVGKLG